MHLNELGVYIETRDKVFDNAMCAAVPAFSRTQKPSMEIVVTIEYVFFRLHEKADIIAFLDCRHRKGTSLADVQVPRAARLEQWKQQ